MWANLAPTLALVPGARESANAAGGAGTGGLAGRPGRGAPGLACLPERLICPCRGAWVPVFPLAASGNTL